MCLTVVLEYPDTPFRCVPNTGAEGTMSSTNIWDSYGRWDEIGKSQNINYIRRRITGGKFAWRPNFVPPAVDYAMRYAIDEARDAAPGKPPAIVDFGCGLGRNGPMLRGIFPRVIGIDLPEMAQTLQSALPDLVASTYDAIHSSAESLVETDDFCALYDSVVLQHITDPAYLAGLIETLNRKPALRTLISIHHGGIAKPIHLRLLDETGWKPWHSESERLSFEGVPHTVVILRRWPASP